MSKNAIQLENLTVRAGRKTILSIDDLSIKHGELVGLLGPNGAGKTTLLRCLLGLQGHVHGEVQVLDRGVKTLGARGLGLLRRRIGYVPQLLPSHSEMPLTVREVVAIGRTGIAGLFRPLCRRDWKIIDEWIERLGLSSLASRGYTQISGGEQRKTLIARAMVQQPELLILDEPTANLDMGWRERIVETISELYQLGNLTVMLVCHELEVLPSCCNRIAILNSGELVADGEPGEVLSEKMIRSLYGSGFDVLIRNGRYIVVPSEVSHA